MRRSSTVLLFFVFRLIASVANTMSLCSALSATASRSGGGGVGVVVGGEAGATIARRLRIAVVGAGVAGCAAARRLVRAADDGASTLSYDVSLYEIGRGPGGRASARRTRSVPDLFVNHGCPYANATSTEGRSLLSSLPRAVRFDGVRASLNAATGAVVERDDDDDQEEAWTGADGDVSSIASDLLEGATDSSRSSVATRYRTMVRGLSRDADGGWELRDGSGTVVGSADWLVVSGSSIAHPRFSSVFGGVPPLVEAAAAADESVRDPALDRALAAIARQESSPVLAVLFARRGPASSSSSLGDRRGRVVLDVEGSDVLSRVVIDRPNDDDDDGWCSVVCHSTEVFALDNQGVYGSTSSAARVGGAANSDPSREAALVDAMLDALRSVPGMSDLVDAERDEKGERYGPFLHRWGSAFPKGDPLPRDLAFLPNSRIGFCGDNVDPSVDGVRIGTLECALLTGTNIGERIHRHLSETTS